MNTLLGGVASEDVSAFVRQGAEGNPLFLEERFASLMETGALAKDERPEMAAGNRWSGRATRSDRTSGACPRRPPGPGPA